MSWPGDFINKIICGNNLSVMKAMPAKSIDMVITSPPYWGLRDYGFEMIFGNKDCEHKWGKRLPEHHPGQVEQTKWKNAIGAGAGQTKGAGNYCLKCQAWKGQLGLEPTPEMYIEHLTEIFNEAKRVLKKEGTLWIVIGDTYVSKPAGNPGCSGIGKSVSSSHSQRGDTTTAGLPPKCLCMIPERLAWSLIQDEDGDIYELDKSYIICNNIDDTKNITEDENATQRSRSKEKISSRICQKVEEGTSKAVSKKNGKVEGGEQGQDKSIQQETLLGSPGTGNSKGNERQCKEISQASAQSIDTLWRKSADVRLLWGSEDSILINRSHRRKGQRTQKENKKIWINSRVVKGNKLSQRFQDFMQKLQLGNGDIWFLPPSRGRNICFRKKDIPIDLLPLFKLKQEERWRLRNKIIWYKPNAMPSSVTDRFSNRWEYVFMFSKNQRYFFDLDAVREPHTHLDVEKYGNIGTWKENIKEAGRLTTKSAEQGSGLGSRPKEYVGHPDGKNPGDVFEINTQPFPEAHFAVFPEKLCEKPIKAGCPAEVCKKCGKARERIVERVDKFEGEKPQKSNIAGTGHGLGRTTLGHTYEGKTIGWTSCNCKAGFEGGIVLDPFAGAGTALLVAKEMKRRFIGIDIKQEYCDMCEKRLAQGVL